jgi:hypothetical protein
MHSAPYIIVGYTLAPGVPDANLIIHDLDTEMPLASTRFALGVGNMCALKVTTANMHARFDDLAAFFVGMNEAHGGAITWFAQLCDEAWLASEP